MHRSLPASPTVLTDAMPQMVWSSKPDGHSDYFNAQWYAFTGVRPGETDGDNWADVLHPDDQELAREAWSHAVATGENYEVEFRLRHHAGGYHWTLTRGLPIRNAEGAIIRWIGTCTDIDSQKRAEQQLSLVTHELSHRIKNIFSVIGGLVALSARKRPEVADYARELASRINALARAHELARPNAPETGTPQPTSLHGLLALLFAPYPAMSEGRIRFSGNDLDVGQGAITALSLLFHELATNAVKYGALSVPDGILTIETVADADHVQLTWCERGGPSVEGEPGRSGFGTELAALAVKRQLGGSIRHAWETPGLVIHLALARSRLG